MVHVTGPAFRLVYTLAITYAIYFLDFQVPGRDCDDSAVMRSSVCMRDLWARSGCQPRGFNRIMPQVRQNLARLPWKYVCVCFLPGSFL